MKKVFALVLALALALSMAVMSSAAAADDLKKVLDDLSETVGPEALKAAFEEAWADVSKKLELPKEAAADAGKMPAGTGNEVADSIIEKLGIKDTDVADKIQKCMTNDFVSFLCGMYTGAPSAPVTGDSSSSVIAIATFAALSAVAAAAFVCMKKKDD